MVIEKVKNTASWTYLIEDFNSEEIAGALYKKEL